MTVSFGFKNDALIFLSLKFQFKMVTPRLYRDQWFKVFHFCIFYYCAVPFGYWSDFQGGMRPEGKAAALEV